VLSWILASLLVIIWLACFLPSRRRSPAASVEEFEQEMSLLADTHRDAPGRWVLMPRRRFLGPRDRARARVVRRRRLVFTGLLEATVLFLLMGLVPPLRPMLYAAGALAFLLLVYATLLVQIRITEYERSRAARRASHGAAAGDDGLRGRTTYPAGYAAERVYAGGNGHGYATTYGNGHDPRAASLRAPARHSDRATYLQVSVDAEPSRMASPNGDGRGSGNGNGSGHDANGRASASRPFDVANLQVLDDDVHVVIRRPEDIEAEAAEAAAAVASVPSAAVR
jgi:hypothetical protein